MSGIDKQLNEVKQRQGFGMVTGEDVIWLIEMVERQGRQIAEYEDLRAAIVLAFDIHPAARPSKVLARLEELFGSPLDIPVPVKVRLRDGEHVLTAEATRRLLDP